MPDSEDTTTGVAEATDRIVEASLARLVNDNGRIECPPGHVRKVLYEALREHASALSGTREMGPSPRPPAKFVFREGKAMEAILHLLHGPLSAVPQFPMLLHHVLYLAESSHLDRYGRPIFCDTYQATPSGPVGTMVARILAGDLSLCMDPAGIAAALTIDRSGLVPVFRALRPVDGDRMSKSDIEELDQACAKVAGRPLRPSATTQGNRAWRLAQPWGAMDWSDTVDPWEPDYESKLEHMVEISMYGSI